MFLFVGLFVTELVAAFGGATLAFGRLRGKEKRFQRRLGVRRPKETFKPVNNLLDAQIGEMTKSQRFVSKWAAVAFRGFADTTSFDRVISLSVVHNWPERLKRMGL